jgi:hypothetical protein
MLKPTAAALVYAWNITRAGFAPLYSEAVQSMSESWKVFFYGAADPRSRPTGSSTGSGRRAVSGAVPSSELQL